MLQEALFSVISSWLGWKAPFLVCFLPMGIKLLSQLATFLFFVSENLPFWDGRDLQRSSCVPEIFPPKRLPCATGALCTSWTVHTHKVGYFKLLKFCGASLAQGGDPGLPEKKKVDVMNQIFCKGVAVLTTF